MSMQYRDPASPISVSGSVRREAALTSFLSAEPAGEPDTELMIHAPGVERVDVVTGAAARMRIARHMRKHPDGGVTIIPPRDGAVAGRLIDLLWPLPEGVNLTAQEDPGERPRYALVPATQIKDAEDAHLAGESALEACEAARVSEDRASIIALAVMDVAENALLHAVDPEDPPVVAATVSGRERFVEVAVVDSGCGISEAESPEELLAGLPAPLNGAGILPELLRLGKRDDLNVRIEILAGTGRLRWRWNGHATTTGVYVPGTTVVVTVNP
jgi:anti-sigma regulatory factor (Ser/Thr protein kinase)